MQDQNLTSLLLNGLNVFVNNNNLQVKKLHLFNIRTEKENFHQSWCQIYIVYINCC